MELITSLSKPYNSTKILSTLLLFLETFIPLDFFDFEECSKIEVYIKSPLNNPEKPVDVLFSVPHKIEVNIDLENLDITKSIVIQATLPDQSIQRFWPPSEDFILRSHNKYTLSTSIYLVFSQPWTGFFFFFFFFFLEITQKIIK